MVTKYEIAYLKARILSNDNSQVNSEYSKTEIKVTKKEMSKSEVNFYEGKFGKAIRVVLQTPSKKVKDTDSYDTLEYNGYEYAITDIQEIVSSRNLRAKEYILVLS